jgi:hypothetical protein
VPVDGTGELVDRDGGGGRMRIAAGSVASSLALAVATTTSLRRVFRAAVARVDLCSRARGPAGGFGRVR